MKIERDSGEIQREPERSQWPWLRLAEPATSLTDLVLGIVALLCAWRLLGAITMWREGGGDTPLDGEFGIEIAIMLGWFGDWRVAFIAIGLAALAGAVEHGVAVERERLKAWVGRLIALLLAVAALNIWQAATMMGTTHEVMAWMSEWGRSPTILASMSYRAGPITYVSFWWAGALKFLAALVYNVFRRGGPSFVRSIVDFGASLGLLAIVAHNTPASPWLYAGIIATVIAGAVQFKRIAPHKQFDHNALFHVLMIPAVWLLCEGAIRAVGGSG